MRLTEAVLRTEVRLRPKVRLRQPKERLRVRETELRVWLCKSRRDAGETNGADMSRCGAENRGGAAAHRGEAAAAEGAAAGKRVRAPREAAQSKEGRQRPTAVNRQELRMITLAMGRVIYCLIVENRKIHNIT